MSTWVVWLGGLQVRHVQQLLLMLRSFSPQEDQNQQPWFPTASVPRLEQLPRCKDMLVRAQSPHQRHIDRSVLPSGAPYTALPRAE